MPELADRILSFVSKKNYQALKPKALARRLGVSQGDYAQFRRVVRSLVQEGRLEMGKSHSIHAAKPHGTLVGIFRRGSSGHGVVRPHPTEALAGAEIFIRAGNVGDASSGDEVLVRLLKRPARAERGPEGEILRIIERATHQFVGTYIEEGGEGHVLVDGTTFSDPIYVGDPGAKGAKVNDKVVFEMIRFPSPVQRGEGVLTEVLGPRGKPGVDTLSVIRAFELPDTFPPDVLREARLQAESFDEEEIDGRTDFTGETVLTIDPADARDFDDAVSLSYDSHRRHWHLAVHIADVGHFVPPGSLLDREARNRGTSVYLPRCVLPMFPEVISNGLASLQQGRLRYVKSALLEFTHAGQRASATFVNGAIRVSRRFTYEQVTEILAEPDRHRGSVGDALIDMLLRMQEFAMTLRQRRLRRGALELTLGETELLLDDEGKVRGAQRRIHDISHQIIEEFMLAANEAVAEHLAEQNTPFLRRIHAPPDPRKLKDFVEFARSLGYELSASRATDRFQLQRLLEESARQPEVYAVHYALLRSLKQAEYHPAEEGHYALASDCYCHFTSPIRRYPDLTVHRLLEQRMRTGRARADEAEMIALGEHCSLTERRAEQAERELIKVKLLEHLRDQIGAEFEIVLTGVHEYGFFGQAKELPVEGLVHVSTLTDDYYYYDGATHSLIGRRTKRRFRLGDSVKVHVARVDVQRRQLDFRLAGTRRRRNDSHHS